MPRLVVLSEGFTGRSYELKVEKTTVGRVEDNAFPIPEPSVSSHHCEISLRGNDVVIKDLNSTNGTFINGEKITEAVLKPGQLLRLGQLEMRLESTPLTGGTGKRPLDSTLVIPQGVKFNEPSAGGRSSSVETTAFQKKNNKTNRIFIAIVVVTGLLLIIILGYVFMVGLK